MYGLSLLLILMRQIMVHCIKICFFRRPIILLVSKSSVVQQRVGNHPSLLNYGGAFSFTHPQIRDAACLSSTRKSRFLLGCLSYSIHHTAISSFFVSLPASREAFLASEALASGALFF